MATRKVRVKKLNAKQPLSILKEDEIDATEYESLTQDLQVATGVEAGEENEYHLQVLLKTAGKKADIEIPVPPPQESSTSYDTLYSRTYTEPGPYVRFSQTVEECIGCLYDMTEEDDVFLKEYNAKRGTAERLSEDDFERIMEAFEETASHQTPYASVDKTILPYDSMVPELALLEAPDVMPFAKTLYEHWKSRRQVLGNGPVHSTLKYETHQDSDDMDPYVCFRRREVRQTRKTRARDVQSADKLKRLRRELEEGRQLISLSHEREVQKQDLLRIDKEIFEKRAQVRDVKVRLQVKSNDDDLLINQKAPAKKKPPGLPAAQRASGPGTIRLQQPRALGPVETDLPLLEVKLARQNEELRNDILSKIQNHQSWNKSHIDLTKGPLPSARSPSQVPSFRAAQAQYLLTPPASSASGESMEEPTPMDLKDLALAPVSDFQDWPTEEIRRLQICSYRRRIGRLNRLWIDRRPYGFLDSCKATPESDRWKYDHDDSEDEQPVYEVDPYDTSCIKFRASIPLAFQDPRRQRQLENHGAAHGAAQAQIQTKVDAQAPVLAAANGQTTQQVVPQAQPPIQK